LFLCPLAVVLKISLAHICTENSLVAIANLLGETSDLTIHFPMLEALTQLAAERIFKNSL
jgi:hypothetical protein